MSAPNEHPAEEESPKAEGYFRRDVDEFHREANVLAGMTRRMFQQTHQKPDNSTAPSLWHSSSSWCACRRISHGSDGYSGL